MMTLLVCIALAQDTPTPEATLAWLQSLDTRPESAQKKPRFPNLTVDDLKTLKDLRLGATARRTTSMFTSRPRSSSSCSACRRSRMPTWWNATV